MIAEHELATYYFPVPGLTVPDEPLEAGGVAFLAPAMQDWRLVEKTDVADRRLLAGAVVAQLGGATEGWVTVRRGQRLVAEFVHERDLRPPMCLVFVRPLESTDGVEDALAGMTDAEAMATDVLLALRLLKRGVFVDFLYTGRYVRAGALSERIPGPYRQLRLDVSDAALFVLSSADVPRVEELALCCRAHRTAGGGSGSTVALHNFRLSHGPHFADRDRLALLFIAMEALFGGYGKSEKAYLGSTMPARAAIAAADQGAREYLARAARLRNAVAHGDPDLGHDPEADVDRLDGILRSALRRYLRFEVAFVSRRDAIRQHIGDRAARTPQRAFNALLGRAWKGDRDAVGLLGD